MGVSPRVGEVIENTITFTKNTTNIVEIDTTEGGTVILDANLNRVSLHIQNIGTIPILIAFGEDPTIDNFSINIPGGSGIRTGDGGAYEDNHPFYVFKGQIKGLVETSTTKVCILEKTKTC